MAKQSKTPIMEYARVGFGSGLGLFASLMLFTLVGVIFFIPGFILVNREQKKPKEEQNQTMKVFGYILMAIGMIVGLGFGAGAFFGELGSEF